jgi:membrane-bound lytic murein transglycosylase D
MGVNIGALSRWNNLYPEKKLMPGDKLKIRVTKTTVPLDEPQGKRTGKEIIYVVKEGDTLWSIAKKFNLTISEIETWNHLNEADRIYPEDRLKLRVGGIKSSTLN